MSEFEFSIPVIIAGGGTTGAVAALAARAAGAEVLLLEQDETARGSTAMSQGLICAAGTRAQAEAGVTDDSADVFFNDIMTKTDGKTDPVIARAIADGAGPCMDWLTDDVGLPYELDVRFRPAYGHTRLRVHGWLAHSGDDVIQLLHQKVVESGADVLFNARLIDIVADDSGRVLGVVVERPGGEIERIGCDALVLATSGFAANEAMIHKYMPELTGAYRNCHEGNDGHGMELGAKLGGALADMGSYQGYAMLADPHGVTLPPGQMVEGGLLLNSRGERFVDELADIAGMVHPVLAQPDGYVWAVFDEHIDERCAYIPETQQLRSLNAYKTGDTIEELAEAIGAPADAVRASLEDAWAAQKEARPDAMGRVWKTDTPPIPAYRALKVRGALYHTQGGLQIDGAAQVLRADNTPLPNLFAGGGAARGVSGPSYWGYLPAMGLCEAATLGRIAGTSAAAHALASANS